MELEIISSLIEVLKKEYKYHQELCETAQAKKQTIIDNNIEKLTEIIDEEKVYIDKLDELESNREKLLKKIAIELKIEENPPQYNLIKTKIPEKYKNELSEIRNKLLEVIEELQEINEQNKSLLEEAIKLNNFNFKLMAEAIEPTNTYSENDNEDDKSNSQHIMDRKA